MKAIVFSVTFVAAGLAFVVWNSHSEHILPFPQSSFSDDTAVPDGKSTLHSLIDFAWEKVLHDAAPIFGDYEYVESDASNWMAAYPDDTLLVHMNLPGAHDAATWNYSDATQEELKRVTSLVNRTIQFSTESFRCQQTSMVHMLNAGIRVFDLRYAFEPTKTRITFWHGPALLSETADLESVLFGFYKWLDDHPSEALFLSFQYEPSEDMGNVASREIQATLYQILMNPAGKDYIRQTRDELGTLGDARGQITLLRRFDLDLLSSDYESSIPGLHFSPNDWIVNGANTTMTYNPSPNSGKETGLAHIQDYYMPRTAKNSTTADNVEEEMEKVIPHFHLAPQPEHRNDLFWHFMSSTNILHEPPITPRMMALGQQGNNVEGVNHRLIPFFQKMKGRRLGIVMFDFFDQPDELLPLFLTLLPPEEVRSAAKT